MNTMIGRPCVTRGTALALGLLLVLGACATPESGGITIAAPPYDPDSGSLAVDCGRLIDVSGGGVQHDVTVLVVDGRIREVGIDLEIPADLPRLDLSAYTVLPGLIDLHTHLTDRPGDTGDLSVFFERTSEEQLAISRVSSEATLRAGFTTVRNVGAYIGWSERDLRDAITAGDLVGPRMQVAGYYLTIPGGGGDLLLPGVLEDDIPRRVRMGVAHSPAEFRQRAEEAVRGRADLLKVIASGAVLAHGGIPGEPEMTPEEIAAVADVAHRAGLRLAAHAHGARSIREAILAGADTIEHASYLDEEGIALAIEHDVAIVMDVYNGDYIDSEGRRQGWPQEFLDKNLETVEIQRRAFTRAVAAGAPLAYGTDSAVYPHGDNARQFRIMVELGMTPMAAIQSATTLAARAMGWDDRVGAVAPGRYADLIAVRGDPLEDITVLEDVAVVIKGGLVFKQE